MSLQKLATYQHKPTGKIWVSYFPCLVQSPGQWMDAYRLPQLQEFQDEMKNIISVGWNQMANNGDVIPIFYVKDAKAIVPHLRDFMRDIPFSFVWEAKKDNHYSLAIIPNVNQQSDLVYWAWSFNSVSASSVPIASTLRATGEQRVCFADVETKEIAGVFAFPTRRLSHIAHADPIRTHAKCYIFQKT